MASTKLIIKNRFFPENLFGSTKTLGKVVFGQHFAYLIVISNYSCRCQNSLYMDTHTLDTDTFS